MAGCIDLRLEQAVAYVSLSAPQRMNAMSRQMWRELAQVFCQLQRDPKLRCVVLRGEGGHFCAGGDISEYADFRFEVTSLQAFHEEDVWGGLQAILDCDVPTVAQIAGNCMGAGVEIACCCDLRVSAAGSRFGAPIGRLGFPMAPKEAALVLRELGPSIVRQMLLGAMVFEAETLRQQGFLHAVVTEESLTLEVDRLVHRVLKLAPQAARMNKRQLRALQPLSLADAAEDAAGLAQAYAYASSAEHREGVMAFINKRDPAFQMDAATSPKNQ